MCPPTLPLTIINLTEGLVLCAKVLLAGTPFQIKFSKQTVQTLIVKEDLWEFFFPCSDLLIK